MKRIILLILLALLLGSTQADAQFYRRDIKAATVTASDSITAVNINITGTATIQATGVTDIVSVTVTADTITVSDTLWATNLGATNITATAIAGTLTGDLTGDVAADTIVVTTITGESITADTVFVADTLNAYGIGARSVTSTYFNGELTGDVIGDVTGDVAADTVIAADTLYGQNIGAVNVTATNISGILTGDVIGDVTGDVAGRTVIASDTLWATNIGATNITATDLTVTSINGVTTYSALLTQIAPAQTSSGTLVIGRKYILTDWITDDDFTNVGAALNEDGQVFIATGTTPTTWTNSSLVDSYGEPVATVLENTLSGTVVWTYTGAGVYAATLAGEFLAANTFIYVNDALAPDAGKIYTVRTSDDVITVYTDITDGTATDDLLTGVSLLIRVYP